MLTIGALCLMRCATFAPGMGVARVAEGCDSDMDFSKLSQNEKLATYGAIAVVIGGLIGYSYGLTVLAVLAAVAALAVIFLPQLSPSTSLPGSRGSLLLVTGGIAAVVMALALVMYLRVIFSGFNLFDLFFLVAVAGAVVLGWASWQEFQKEGGKFQLGAPAGSGAASAPAQSPAPSSTDARPAAEAAPEAAAVAPAPPPGVATEPAAPAVAASDATAQAPDTSGMAPTDDAGERPPS